MSIKNGKYILFLSLLFLWGGISAQLKKTDLFDIAFKNTTIDDALLQLSEVTHTAIAYDSKLFKKENKRIYQDYKSKSIDHILGDLLSGTGVGYKYKKDHLILYKLPLKEYHLSGYIRDTLSGEKLIGATIFDQSSGRGVIANEYGFFSLSLPEGKHQIVISYLGYQAFYLNLNWESNQFLQIALKAENIINEVVITEHISSDTLMLNINENIQPNQINSLTTNIGEPDIIHYLQSTTGVQSGSDGLGGLNVRGGNADQNIILLDDAPIFQPSHTFGLFSIFNPDAIRSICFSKDGFTAKHGGRLSSILNIRTKEGNTQHLNASISTSLLATNITADIPVVKNKSSLFVAFRRSHLDPLINNQSNKLKKKNDDSGSSSYYFYDFNIKYHTYITPKDRFYISAYKGRDNYKDDTNFSDSLDVDFILKTQQNQSLNWGNTFVSLRWNHIYGDKLFSNLTITQSEYQYQSELKQYDFLFLEDTISQYANQSLLRSSIKDSNVKMDFNYYRNSHHKLNFGFEYLNRQFETSVFRNEFYSEEFVEDYNKLDFENSNSDPIKMSANEFNAYIEDRIIIHRNLLLNIGVRTTVFHNVDYLDYGFQPRINLRYKIKKGTFINIDISKMSQNLHVLTSSGGGLPTDIWVPSNSFVGPKHSWQLSSKYSMSRNVWKFDIGVYYKNMIGLIQYYEEAKLPFIMNNDPSFWEDEVTVGTGTSYGSEVEFSIKTNMFYSKINYTYSKSNRKFDGVNDGEVFPYLYDQPHHINIHLATKLTKKTSFTIGWKWHTGTPYTLYRSAFKFNPLVEDLYFGGESSDGSEGKIGLINGNRLDSYHNLSAKIDYKWSYKNYAHHISLGVTNIYNRKNNYFKYEYLDIDNDIQKTNKNTFPILPSLRYNLKFGGNK